MFAFMVCILTVHRVYSACNVASICTDTTAVQNEILDQHNTFRRDVEPAASNMLKMSWSQEAADSAQAWVDQCELKHGPASTRTVAGYEYGENLFYSSGVYSWTDVVGAWHKEVNHYQYPTGSTDGQETGHYTQVVWSTSYQIGCGVSLCGTTYFYGCHYYRAGNFRGYAPYKAGETCGDCPNACDNKLCTNACPYINTYSNCAALKEEAGCTNEFVATWCPAACQCEDEIIPIGKK